MVYVKGVLVGGRVLVEAKADKQPLYAFMIDDAGRETEVLANSIIGKRGDEVEFPVNPKVRKDKAQKLVDGVTLWFAGEAPAALASIPGF